MNAMARRRPREEMIGPTLETLAKLQTDTLQTMMGTGLVSVDEERAGREITDIHRAVQRGLFRTQRMGAGGGFCDPSDSLTEAEARIYSRRYLPWSREAAKHLVARWPTRLTQLDLVLKVCDDNETITELARLYDMNDARMLAAFLKPLRLYSNEMRWA